MNNETFSKKAIRHGEVVIVPVDDLPEGVDEVYNGKEYVIGHSETGHNHIAFAGVGGSVQIFRPAGADDGTLYMRVTGKDGRVEHKKAFDKHETKTLFKGLYAVTIKKAYDYFAKRMTRVQD